MARAPVEPLARRRGRPLSALYPWLLAARPRTLLLASAGVLLGTLLAAADGRAAWGVAALTLLTATALQVLSNLANDYGDSLHGADSGARLGPARAVQSGLITLGSMRRAVLTLTVLTAASGLALIWLALGARSPLWALGFALLGGAAIWAAIAYTATARPYGYAGLGDLLVLIFFGPVAVLGSYLLQAQTLRPSLWLPALSAGLLATAVLNVNNLRDLASDRAAGKRSVPVRLGPRWGRLYHLLLLTGAVVAAAVYAALEPPAPSATSPWRFLFVLALPPLAASGAAVWRRRDPRALDPLLKQTALSALAFALLLGLGQWLAR